MQDSQVKKNTINSQPTLCESAKQWKITGNPLAMRYSKGFPNILFWSVIKKENSIMTNNVYIETYLKETRKGSSVKDAVAAVSIAYNKDKEMGYNKARALAHDFFCFLAYFTSEILKNENLITNLYQQSQKDPSLSVIKDVGDERAKKKYKEDEKLYEGLTKGQIDVLDTLTDNINDLCEKCKVIIFMEFDDGSYFQVFDHIGQKDMLKNMLLNAISEGAYLLIVADDRMFGFYCADGDFKASVFGEHAASFTSSLYEKDLMNNGMNPLPTPIDASYMLIPK